MAKLEEYLAALLSLSSSSKSHLSIVEPNVLLVLQFICRSMVLEQQPWLHKRACMRTVLPSRQQQRSQHLPGQSRAMQTTQPGQSLHL